ncbi:Transposase C of IS166 homeodomain-containing protein, partial [Caloramator quimbayensis]
MVGLNIENQLNENAKDIISKLQKELADKDLEINNLKNELEFLKNQILNKNKKIFGKSSEQLNVDQISLFNEAEKYSNDKEDEPTIEEITYKRKKK